MSRYISLRHQAQRQGFGRGCLTLQSRENRRRRRKRKKKKQEGGKKEKNLQGGAMDEESFRLLEEDHQQHQHEGMGQIVVFRDEEDEEEKVECPSGSSNNDIDSDADPEAELHMEGGALALQPTTGFVDPEPHVSTQFYTFNRESHHLMVHCILEGRFATPEEIKGATSQTVLASWRGVWKDRNEDTAYLTGWKRIQDKLNAHVDEHGNEVLYFKNNSQQYVSHVNQWQDIVMGFHGDADLKHLGLKETVERIKQVWTVGAKFYGIPESFIRVCIASCAVCCSDAGGAGAGAPRSKRRRFEYTESFEVQAREVPQRLQQLAAKHKVVLCIRQKYIRYKPFMAEVKDYACHRAGEPNTKRSGVLKRERYASKRCGCGFRIRAIVPITNYNEKDKTFSYQEEGNAIFKLYAVHSGHEPGPHEGSARVIHRFVGAAALEQQDPAGYGHEDPEGGFVLIGKEEPDARFSVLQQVQELRMEVGFLEAKIANMPQESLASLSQDLCTITQRLRSIEDVPRPAGVLMAKPDPGDDMLVVDPWGPAPHQKDGREMIRAEEDDEDEDEDETFAQWQRPRLACAAAAAAKKAELQDEAKPEKWLDSVKEACVEFDEKSILVCEDSKPIRPDAAASAAVADGNLVGMQVDGFYQEDAKWYDGVTYPTADCGDDLGHTVQEGFRHGGIA